MPRPARSAIHATVVLLTIVGGSLVAQAESTIIRVNSRDAPPPGPHVQKQGATPRTVTLHVAFEQAARDPADNLITFDPSLFADRATQASPPPLKPTRTLRVRAQGGHDRIDGQLPDGSIVVLDLANVPGEGIKIGPGGRLTLMNLAIQNAAGRPILATGNARLTLDRVGLRHAGGPAIVAFGRVLLTLTRCALDANATHGIELHDKASASLDRCRLANNRQSALALFDHASATAVRCQLIDNGDWNVVLNGQSRVRMERSRLTGSRFAQLDAGDASHAHLTDCTLTSGRQFGVFATGQTRLTIERSRIRRQGTRGIELQDTARLKLNESRISSCDEYGTVLFGQSRIEAQACTFAYNGAHGISLRDRADGRLDDCRFTGNRYSGVGCLDAGDGGRVFIRRCTFQYNGMRPIYRGPVHIDPLVPTPIRLDGQTVHVQVAPHARVELFLDRRGEASQYLRTLDADPDGHFQVDRAALKPGEVITATATTPAGTSECNVIAGADSGPILAALLAQTGPLSDRGHLDFADAGLRRWAPGTRLVFHLENPPNRSIETYARQLVRWINAWTRGQLHAQLVVGEKAAWSESSVVIPIRYLDPQTPELVNRGGITFMKWAPCGSFVRPMVVLLARGDEDNDACPRILAHELGHTLGLGHARVGLLSRMQGAVEPAQIDQVNDFSPILTFYDVQALHILYRVDAQPAITLAELIARGDVPPMPVTGLARSDTGARPTFSPPIPRIAAEHLRQAVRP